MKTKTQISLTIRTDIIKIIDKKRGHISRSRYIELLLEDALKMKKRR